MIDGNPNWRIISYQYKGETTYFEIERHGMFGWQRWNPVSCDYGSSMWKSPEEAIAYWRRYFAPKRQNVKVVQ